PPPVPAPAAPAPPPPADLLERLGPGFEGLHVEPGPPDLEPGLHLKRKGDPRPWRDLAGLDRDWKPARLVPGYLHLSALPAGMPLESPRGGGAPGRPGAPHRGPRPGREAAPEPPPGAPDAPRPTSTPPPPPP